MPYLMLSFLPKSHQPGRRVLALIPLLLMCVSAVASDVQPERRPIQAPRSQAETDALVRAARSTSARERYDAIKRGAGVMRPDFKAAVAAATYDPVAWVRTAALEAVVPSRVTQAYDRRAESLAPTFPGRVRPFAPCSMEGPNEFHYGWSEVIEEFEVMGPAAVPVLVGLLRSPDECTRRIALGLIGKAGRRDAVPHVVPLLRDPDPMIRRRAAKVLGVLGGGQALDALASLGNKAPDDMVAVAAEYLSYHGDDRALPMWRHLLGRTNGGVDREVHAPLKQHRFHDAVTLLIDCLEMRVQARTRRGGSAIHAALKELTARDFGDPTREGSILPPPPHAEQEAVVRRWKAWWAEASRLETYEVLAGALDDGAMSDPLRALLNLCELGDPRAIPLLLGHYGRTFQRRYMQEHVTVEWALQTLSGRTFPSREAWQQWWDASGDSASNPSVLSGRRETLQRIAAIPVGPVGDADAEICTDGHILFVAGGGHFELYDVRRPTDPQMRGRYESPPHSLTHIAAQQSRLCVWGGYRQGVTIYGYTAQGDLHLTPDRVWVQFGERQLVSSDSGKVPNLSTPYKTCHFDRSLVRVSDRRSGAIVGESPAGFRDRLTAVADGERVYVASDLRGLVVYDLSDTTPGRVIGHARAGAAGQKYTKLCIGGDHLYALTSDGMVHVFRITPQ